MVVCWRQVRAKTILKRAPQLEPESLKRPRPAYLHTVRDPHYGAAGPGPGGHPRREALGRRGVAGFVSFLPVRRAGLQDPFVTGLISHLSKTT